MCGGSGDTGKAPARSALRIVLVDSLSVEYEDGERHLPENIRDLCDVIVSDSKDCNRTFILDPILLRLDLEKEFSLKTTIEKGGSKDITNTKVISKLIKKNLEAINISKDFTKPVSNKKVNELLTAFIFTKANKDSILVFSTNNVLSEYLLNNKKFKVYTSNKEVRDRMNYILCENEKANFTVLIDPPVVEGPIAGTPIPNTLSIGQRVIKKPIIKRSSYRKASIDNSDLTIIKGSEGCDVCTRFYSARDNLGRIRQITQSNSIDCCPCGKTIEMKGHTYRMECSGGGNNKLSLIE